MKRIRIPPTIREKIYRRDQHKCRVCGKKVRPGSFGADDQGVLGHLFPVEFHPYAAKWSENMVLVCWPCERKHGVNFRYFFPDQTRGVLLHIKHAKKRI